MKKSLLFVLLAFLSLSGFSQKVTGQWRGSFDSNGDIVLAGSNSTEYVLELEINGTTVTGSSYSYFQGRKYYVICRLEGTFYKNSKSVKVTEVERIKGNTPPDFSDCLQVHFLTYEKKGNTEKLVGRWKTAPGQSGSCGEGNTELVRRTLTKDLSSFSSKKAVTTQPAAKTSTAKKTLPAKKTPPVAVVAPKPVPKTKSIAPATPATPKVTIAAAVPKQKKAAPVTKPDPKSTKAAADTDVAKVTPKEKRETERVEPAAVLPEIEEIKSDINFEKRKTDVLKTIEIENETFKIDLYDNGEVDGDSVSVFYNNRLILSHKRLSEKPISLTLPVINNSRVNELVMYAENLGEIAPNTALMVVHDGEKRYEVRISSDLKNSGTIRFIRKDKTQ